MVDDSFKKSGFSLIRAKIRFFIKKFIQNIFLGLYFNGKYDKIQRYRHYVAHFTIMDAPVFYKDTATTWLIFE